MWHDSSRNNACWQAKPLLIMLNLTQNLDQELYGANTSPLLLVPHSKRIDLRNLWRFYETLSATPTTLDQDV
jgi:hypothetical protein